ncbi:MAG TPA: hypothetical protein PKN56_16475 [Leptospiraceae bacterium]|nr:hypothetical protein [Leptospiraceae bacterium]HNN05161.1 hypothetical protein [Leptospiraceae bacterium]
MDFPKVVLTLLSGLSKSLGAEVYDMIPNFRTSEGIWLLQENGSEGN